MQIEIPFKIPFIYSKFYLEEIPPCQKLTFVFRCPVFSAQQRQQVF